MRSRTRWSEVHPRGSAPAHSWLRSPSVGIQRSGAHAGWCSPTRGRKGQERERGSVAHTANLNPSPSTSCFFFVTVSADTARRGVTSKRTGACASRTSLAAAFGTLQQMLIKPRTHDGDDTSWSTCCLVGDLVAEVVPLSLTQALLSMLAVPSCGAGVWRPQSQTCCGVASALARMQECAAGVAWRWV